MSMSYRLRRRMLQHLTLERCIKGEKVKRSWKVTCPIIEGVRFSEVRTVRE